MVFSWLSRIVFFNFDFSKCCNTSRYYYFKNKYNALILKPEKNIKNYCFTLI